MREHQGIGAAVRRKEDRRFVTGHGRYVGDLAQTGELQTFFLRSPFAHAGVQVSDVADALAAPGVFAILTGIDMAADGLGTIPVSWMIPDAGGAPMFVPPRHALATDTVRFVGEPLAMVVAETLNQAKDAADLIAVDFDERPAAATLAAASAPDAPPVWPDRRDNSALTWTLGDRARAEELFAQAHHVTRIDLVNNRIAPTSVEPRTAVGAVEGDGRLTLTSSAQLPHELRRMLAKDIFRVPEGMVHVIAPDVGGGFGTKAYLYPEEIAVLWAARRVGRPVRWTGDRSEAFLSDAHARDHLTHAELALDRDGRFLALRVTTRANMGAYLSQHAQAVPTIYSAYVLPGPYRFEAVDIEIRNVFSHSAPTDAYRGAGRSEAVTVTERIVDQASRELGVDAAELRRQNLVRPIDLPYQTATGSTFDSGEPEALLDRALEISDAGGYPARLAASRSGGLGRGLGLAMYAANCGLCASRDGAAVGSLSGSWESARLRIHPTGSASLFMGTHSHGQGHETTFAQLVADRLGLALDKVEVVFGDTDKVQQGMGTYASRSLVIGGPAALIAIDKVVDKARRIAAHLLEASVADIEFTEGAFRIAGTDRVLSFGDVALQAYVPHDFPHDELEPGLDETGFFEPRDFTWPMGAHIAEVEVDPATGLVRLNRYTAVDDVGNVVNPMIVEGQVHGGIVQGIGQALWEEVVYDAESGQLLTGSPMDYGLPRADRLPSLATATMSYATANNPLGAKGAGEIGTFAAPAAVMNAIMDALAPLGVTRLDMPATPDKVWRALEAAKDG